MLGIAMAVLAALFWGLFNGFARLATERLRPTTAAYAAIVPALAVALVAALANGGLGSVAAAPPTIWIVLILAGVLNYFMGLVLNFISVNRVGAGRTAAITCSRIMVAAILALLALREPLTPRILGGIAFIMAGVYLSTQED